MQLVAILAPIRSLRGSAARCAEPKWRPKERSAQRWGDYSFDFTFTLPGGLVMAATRLGPGRLCLPRTFEGVARAQRAADGLGVI